MTSAEAVRATVAERKLPSDRRVLLCASPREYWEWQGKPGKAPPPVVINPDRAFCHDSGDPEWCQAERADGRCYLTDSEFADVQRRLRAQATDDDEREVTTVGRLPSITPDGWTVWTFAGRGLPGPSLTISHDGELRISRAADEAIGKPGFIQVLYRAGDRSLAVRACAADAEGAFALKPTRRGGFAFRAGAMLDHYGIEHATTRRWAATVEGRMLIVRLGDVPQWESAGLETGEQVLRGGR